MFIVYCASAMAGKKKCVQQIQWTYLQSSVAIITGYYLSQQRLIYPLTLRLRQPQPGTKVNNPLGRTCD